MQKPIYLFAILTLTSAWTARVGGISTASAQAVHVLDTSSVGVSVTPPQPVVHPVPPYTMEARQRGIEGTVVVQAQFDIDGSFKVLRVVKKVGYGLDEAAQGALDKWRFSPAMSNGRRVSVIAEIEIPFRLADDRERKRQNLEEQQQRLQTLKNLVSNVLARQAAADQQAK